MRAPERIWFADRPDDDLTMRLLAAPPGPEDVDYVEYVRADLHGQAVDDLRVAETDHVAAGDRAEALAAEIERLRSALTEIANHPTTQRNPDGVDQAAHSMQLIAREALAGDPYVCLCGGAGCVACDHPTESASGLDVGAEIAAEFHARYEALAPHYGYETREASAVPWRKVPEPNRQLMTAVVGSLLAAGVIEPGHGPMRGPRQEEGR